jgi:VIT1/CCC1 family predicted Fe2+/Mn2+ transporter
MAALRQRLQTKFPLPKEKWHRTGSNWSLRAAVLGVNDGLVSNFCLVMGVSGGTSNPNFILLAGVAGLVAGALSMMAGEYVSVRAQRDIFERQLEIEAWELQEEPEEELQELIQIYQAKGLTRTEAETVAERIMADPEVALDTHAREELGLDPSQLGGSPWGAALSSFIAFTLGALVPILPYIMNLGAIAFFTSIILSTVCLISVGAVLAYLSAKPIWWGGVRMLLAGGFAAAVTFGIGTLVGVAFVD